jgi:hypothetical protein
MNLQIKESLSKLSGCKYDDEVNGFILIENERKFVLKVDDSSVNIRFVFAPFESEDVESLKVVVGRVNKVLGEKSSSISVRINRNTSQIVGVKVLKFDVVDTKTLSDSIEKALVELRDLQNLFLKERENFDEEEGEEEEEGGDISIVDRAVKRDLPDASCKDEEIIVNLPDEELL